MAKKTRRALDNVDIGGLNADLESGPHLGTEVGILKRHSRIIIALA